VTKAQARQLIVILAMKRIAFKLRREGNSYIVTFPQAEALAVAKAIGA
jgi:hypothetical protein